MRWLKLKQFGNHPSTTVEFQSPGITAFLGENGAGKCLGPEVPVLRYDGLIVPAAEVKVGDVLMGPDSSPRNVLGVTSGTDWMYKIVPKRGEVWRCNSEHMLTVVHTSSFQPFDIPLKQYLAQNKTFKRLHYMFRSGCIDKVQTGDNEYTRDPLRVGFSVKPDGLGEYAGFQVDGDGRFLLGDFTVTHNSMISEALCWLLYGRLIRAKQGWSPVVPGETKVMGETDSGLLFSRESLRSGSRFSIDNFSGGTREANRLIKKKYGAHSRFLRTSVFQRAALVSFTAAGDAERRALIEDMLGLDYFDKLYTEIRAEYRQADTDYKVARNKVELLLEALAGKREALEYGRGRKPEFQWDEEWKEAREAQKKLLANEPPVPGERPNDDAYYDQMGKVARTKASIASATADLEKIKDLIARGKCPECGQPTGVKLPRRIASMEKYLEKARRLRKKQANRLSAIKADLDLAMAGWEEAAARRERWVRDLKKVRDEIAFYESAFAKHREAVVSWRDGVESFASSVREAESAYNLARLDLSAADLRLARLRDLSRVFAPKGARLYMLTEALGQISASASVLMTALYGRPTKVQLRHTDSNTLALEIEHEDFEPFSYRGCSEGERTLVDFALLKVLSSMQRAKTAEIPVIYDDLLDAVSSSNQVRVLQAIEEEAQSTQVLFFSHQTDLEERMPGARIYMVEDGQARLL